MHALVLGGTAFTGREIVLALGELGFGVTVFTHDIKVPEGMPPHEHFKGSRQSSEDLKRVASVKPWDLVVDNLGYTARDLELVLPHFRSVRRFLFHSTISLYRYIPPPMKQPILESAVNFEVVPANEDLSDVHWQYARGKWEAERLLQRHREFPWTSFRPTVTYGPNDLSERGFWYLARLLEGGPILVSDKPRRFRLTASRDVALAMSCCIDELTTLHQSYHIACSEIVTLEDFIRDSAQALGVKADIIKVSDSKLPSSLAGPLGELEIIPDLNAAIKDFNFQPTPWTKMITETARWFEVHSGKDRKRLLHGRSDEISLARSLG